MFTSVLNPPLLPNKGDALTCAQLFGHPCILIEEQQNAGAEGATARNGCCGKASDVLNMAFLGPGRDKLLTYLIEGCINVRPASPRLTELYIQINGTLHSSQGLPPPYPGLCKESASLSSYVKHRRFGL